ncbi:High-affinity zinc uptake system protein ZnuA precursor [Falsiruegeria litorea R37]|uniref:High-affinity zinc uptake system protein ZnuA n=1 Tax=Falsiruegeria litorea R37 TaxID=1200284 RepID=A0A1Y5S1H0_9RHOB|nr:zinc ABC transporter substrate-binding protein [Falsiruegeria litorea]SLN29483.1 High-affinity zinc uptake system protein ZnuA precursor [Falsiruegeria litorea R37]
MLRTFALSAVSLSALSVAAFAEPPKVATDIAPIHSLVSQVMNTVGEPSLIVRQGASPHGYSMRPSEARALQNADLVVWVGPELTPWFEKPLSSLSEGAAKLELLEVPGTLQLEYRDLDEDDHDKHGDAHAEGDDHDGHDDDDAEHDNHDKHDDDHAEHDDHDKHDDDHAEHDNHDKHDDDHAEHDDHEKHDDHGADEDHAESDDHGHDHHEGLDPHAWLDPQNAQVWVLAIAERLAELDAENAEVYLLNAKAAVEVLKAQEAELAEQMAGLSDQPYVAFHDAFQYFESRFDLKIAGTIALGDASDPSPARVAALRDRIVDLGVTCAYAEPQYDPRLLEAATETGEVEIRVIDPLGSTLSIGAGLYGQLIAAMADEFAACAN